MTLIIIQQWQEIVALSILSASLSLFLDFCFREGNIFSGWLEFWARWWLKRNGLYKVKRHNDRELLLADCKWWWFKPLGYCIVCSNVWVSVGVALILCPVCILPVILLSNFLVRYFYNELL